VKSLVLNHHCLRSGRTVPVCRCFRRCLGRCLLVSLGAPPPTALWAIVGVVIFAFALLVLFLQEWNTQAEFNGVILLLAMHTISQALNNNVLWRKSSRDNRCGRERKRKFSHVVPFSCFS